MEALIAAVFLDQGLDVVTAMIERFWAEDLDAVSSRSKDAKTLLQEWAAQEGHPMPRYRQADRSGPDHAPTFTMEVELQGVGVARGEAKSKQEAERSAAQALLTTYAPHVEAITTPPTPRAIKVPTTRRPHRKKS
jgi:ribonuclease III